MKKTLLFSSSLLLVITSGFAQVTKRHCSSHKIHEQKLASDPSYAARVALRTTTAPSPLKSASEATYNIPVVVHVIHNGEAVGVGQNISDAQINSAIDALNKDFNLMNGDSLKPTHAFYSLQANVKIQFCLAKKDPQGAATTGINRVNKGQDAWTVNDFDATVKPSTIWDHTKYMNIWITSFAAPDDQTLGYATFPDWTSATTDGVVIGATFFGTTGNVSPGFDLNRTATHEVGHYFGLYHIWGDETCGDDLVSDTPTQEADNAGCPSFPHNVSSSCNPGANGEMYMNYMDYVDDACMSLFTVGQKTRMRDQLMTYRSSLTTSDACNNPTNSIADLGIDANVYPNPASQNVNVVVPENFGSYTVEVISLSGAVVLTANVASGATTLNTSGLANGNYVLKLTSAFGTINESISIIQ